jgi:pilus assembly protein CpaB
MNVKKFLPLIAAVGLGLVALIVAHSGMGRGAKPADTTVHVIVAKESVAPGQTLTVDNLTDQAIAGTTVPPTAHTRMDDVLGRVTVAPMVPGQPVLDAFLAAPGALSGLPALVPPGMTTGVAGLISPGAHVDIVSVLNQGEKDKTCARTVASNVPVVAVGQRLSANRPDNDTSMARTVTLICKPREAELITLACTSANTRLVLRGNGDIGPADSRGVIFSDLLGNPMSSRNPAPLLAEATANPVGSSTTQPAVVANAAPAMVANAAPVSHVRRVELIQGSNVTTVSFDMPDNSGNTADPDDYGNADTNYVIPNQK